MRLCSLLLGLAMTAVLTCAVSPSQAPPADAGAFPEPVSAPSFAPAAAYAKEAMVAAAHPLAARAGVEILRAGGSALDAAVAVQMVLNVVEPQSSGIGGGCFLVAWDAKTKEVQCYDGREETPAGARREQFLGPDGKVRTDALVGGVCVGVPGAVAALHLAHAKLGKLPWAQLFEPAIALAEQGHGVTPRLRVSIEANRERFLQMPASAALFLRPDRSVPELGEVLKNPDLGRTLRLLAAEGPKAFRQGELAEKIVAAVRQAPLHPGTLSLDDLKNYRPLVRAPVRVSYRGYEIVGMPPPASGTLTLGVMLALLETTDPQERRPGTPAEADLFARAESVAFADRNAYLGDPAFSDLPMERLLDRERLRQRREALNRLKPGSKAKAGPRPGGTAAAGAPDPNPLEGENTTHFSIVDADGNVVALTTTIEHGMGSGLVVPGGGFLLNNQLTDFDLEKGGGPNALEARRVPRPDGGGTMGKRPRSSMTPLIVFKDGKPVLAIGSPGGSKIIGAVAQSLIGVLDHGLDVQAAINLPRVSCRNRGKLELEGHYPNRAAAAQALQGMGWQVEPLAAGYEAWGGVHAIRRLPDGRLEGGADPRREGAVRGW